MPRRTPTSQEQPTKEQILNYIEKTAGHVSKRDIARAFQLSGPDRIWLKSVLKELEEEGQLERHRGWRVSRSGRLPEVTVIRVSHVDEDGEVVAKPISWPEGTGDPPTIYLSAVRRRGLAPGIGDRVLARLSPTSDGTYEARPIKVLGPDMRQLLGVFERDQRGKGVLHPTDRRQKYPYHVISDQEGGAQPGEYVIAEPVGGGRNQKARILERIGREDDPKSISLVAIHTHGLPVEFSPNALAQAERAQPAELGDREDLRSIPLVTIDGADARDFDDAVFAEPDSDKKNEGGWRIIVAIADVAWYVHPDDDLDSSARERGNSAYFPDRVVPMLPEKLSNDLCSLRPGEDRACIAVDMSINKAGNLLSQRFFRGLMRSVARLTYEQVQAASDGIPDDKTRHLTKTVIEPLFGAYTALARARDYRGTLNLDIPERQVLFQQDGWIEQIVPRARYDSHRLIEEFMITANVAAAEALHAKKKPVIYRVHEPPGMGDIEKLRESLNALGFKLARAGTLRPAHFSGLLEQAMKTDKLQIVSDLILRAQSKAVYSPDEKGHFGLALRRYCHFTSPIRRYADLLVHRSLIQTMKLGKGGLPAESEDKLVEVGEQISATERRATSAERDALDRFTSAFLADRVGGIFSGRISGVTRFGLFIRLNETGADGFVPIRTLPWDHYHHDETLQNLKGEQSGLIFSLGQSVQSKLLEAEPRTGSMIFSILVDSKTARNRGSKTTSRQPRKRSKRRRRRG